MDLGLGLWIVCRRAAPLVKKWRFEYMNKPPLYKHKPQSLFSVWIRPLWWPCLIPSFHFLIVAAPQFFLETYLSPELRDRFLYTYTFYYCKSIKWKCELVSEFWSMRFFYLLNCMLKNADGLIVARQRVRVYNGWKTWSDKRKNKRINKTKTTTTPTSTEDIRFMRYYMSTVSTQQGMCISYWYKFILDKLPK